MIQSPGKKPGDQDSAGGKKRLLLIRHGRAGDPETRRFIGQTETRLTRQGRLQANALAGMLADVSVSRIVCSDLVRSRQTAEIIAENRSLAIETDLWLREIYLGDWEGLSFEQVKQEDPEGFSQRGQDLAGFRPPRGESFADLQARIVPVFQRIADRTEGTAAVVSHAGVNRAILCHWLAMPIDRLFSLAQDPGSLSVIDFEEEDRVIVRCLNLVPGFSL
ncbi:MAG: histidine phosphatase family protein [Thermodesulfobacteriota bacterium]